MKKNTQISIVGVAKDDSMIKTWLHYFLCLLCHPLFMGSVYENTNCSSLGMTIFTKQKTNILRSTTYFFLVNATFNFVEAEVTGICPLFFLSLTVHVQTLTLKCGLLLGKDIAVKTVPFFLI